MFQKIIYLIHILFVAPLLVYAGHIGRKLTPTDTTDTTETNDKTIFNVLIVTGIIVLLYHIYKLIM